MPNNSPGTFQNNIPERDREWGDRRAPIIEQVTILQK
jgi:hypothetical protein